MSFMESSEIYGFGSAFTISDKARDIDLLIVHKSTDFASCLFAITCKQRLIASVFDAHITMLSENEEKHCDFIETAQALRLGTIFKDSFDTDLTNLVTALRELRRS
ncbi:hypothetical protein FF124_07600 [Martelella lutilitoris]|uniref:Nucleotidyltransferase domain-containing protein n=1 Tax=Martelella lutilitoris TaxID=2583532 RepID=A0A5C4JS24_9HYPH|nr:hypothetical protein [Martelella lutilitoris]TNB48193.1 hypothetical protein FF124_07600 [Martelella lutilitoris]